MTTVLIKHPVEDYDRWKTAFDAFHDYRKTGGETRYQIYRPVDDPTNIVILFEWDSVDNAKTFLDLTELKEAMQRAGVSGPPDITIMDMADSGST